MALGPLSCFIGFAFIRAMSTPCLQLTCRAAEWPVGTKEAFSWGYLWSNGKARLSKKLFSNRPWPLNLSSAPEVHAFKSLCPQCALENPIPSLQLPCSSQDHMYACVQRFNIITFIASSNIQICSGIFAGMLSVIIDFCLLDFYPPHDARTEKRTSVCSG